MLCAGARASEQGAVGHEPPPLTLDDQLKNPQAWRNVETAYREIFRLHLRQVSSAKMGQIEPGVHLTVRVPMGGDSPWIEARCGRPQRQCPDRAEIVEKRLMAASLLRSLPTGYDAAELFDPKTFAIRDRGRWALGVAMRRYPDLWKRLKLMSRADTWRHSGGSVPDPDDALQ
jgi:hypothetical protein